MTDVKRKYRKWSPELIDKLRYYKQKGLFHRDIAKKLGFSKYAIINACTKFGCRLDQKSLLKIATRGGKVAGHIQTLKARNRGIINKFDCHLGYDFEA